MNAGEGDVVFVESADGQLMIPIHDPGDESGDVAAPPPHTSALPPRLRRVWMRNFKGFSSFDASLGTFNVLAGANNAGKSTLLQGVDLLYALMKLHAEGNHLAPRGRLVPAAILPVASPRDLFFRQNWRRGNVYVEAVVGAEFLDGSTVEFGLRFMFGNVNSRLISQSGVEDHRLQSLLGRPAVWVPSAVGIVRDEEYRPPARQRGLISAGRHNEVLRNLLVEIKSSRPDRLEAIQQILMERFSAGVGEIGFDMDIDQFVTGTYRAADGTEHDLYSAGAGFVQILQMLAFVFARVPSVVLLDEPDAHLHSSLQRVVVEILDELSRVEGFQVLLATHSKEIINFVDPTRLILIEPGQESASLVTTEVTPIAVLRSLGAIDNVDAYALVKNRRCLFVEGTGDVSILGRFAATLGIHAFTGDDRVVTVPVGGADRFEHVQQLDVFEALLGSPLQTLELRDRDGQLSEYRQRAMNVSRRDLHIFELDSIESYLVNVSVLTRVIAGVLEERGSAEPQPTESDVVDLITAAGQDLRQSAEDRVAERYSRDAWYHDNDRVSIPTANERARAHLEENWSSLEVRLAVLPGKRLLSAIRKRIQDAYGVNFGNERLAEEFRPDEIPPEIVGALQRVAAMQ